MTTKLTKSLVRTSSVSRTGCFPRDLNSRQSETFSSRRRSLGLESRLGAHRRTTRAPAVTAAEPSLEGTEHSSARGCTVLGSHRAPPHPGAVSRARSLSSGSGCIYSDSAWTCRTRVHWGSRSHERSLRVYQNLFESRAQPAARSYRSIHGRGSGVKAKASVSEPQFFLRRTRSELVLRRASPVACSQHRQLRERVPRLGRTSEHGWSKRRRSLRRRRLARTTAT